MIFFALLAALATLIKAVAAKDGSCVLIDFTAADAEFAELNAALVSPSVKKQLGSMMKRIDPIEKENVTLDDASFGALGLGLTLSTTIESLSVSGLSTIALLNVDVKDSNSVSIKAGSPGKVNFTSKMTIHIKELHATIEAQVRFVLVKPKFKIGIEADMFACAPKVPESQCSNLTVAGLQSDFVSLSSKSHHASILKKLLMKFKKASATSFSLKFESVTGLTTKFDSPNALVKTLIRVLPEYSEATISPTKSLYQKLGPNLNEHVPLMLNTMIASKLEPFFGATCLSEEQSQAF
ncbi:hypothetical protein CCR75_008823 [Bremia lactucae]|uniref:Secreted RxLR effector n=1 Tax=Bremia lactucae TaxID=4779 RepID=A0A976FR24_BRELC|nr:hypothetical protein CCR75_008823 [Bremia lactucae]